MKSIHLLQPGHQAIAETTWPHSYEASDRCRQYVDQMNELTLRARMKGLSTVGAIVVGDPFRGVAVANGVPAALDYPVMSPPSMSSLPQVDGYQEQLLWLSLSQSVRSDNPALNISDWNECGEEHAA